MLEQNLMFMPHTVLEEPPQGAATEDSLWVAALAAALVEYRRYVGQRKSPRHPLAARPNWRLVTRLEQLKGIS